MDAKKKKLFRWRGATLYMLLFDIFSVNLAFGLALWIRYDCRFSAIPDGYLHAWLSFVPIYAVVCIVVYYLMKLYNSIWKFASFDELTRSGAAVLITAAIHTLAITLIFYGVVFIVLEKRYSDRNVTITRFSQLSLRTALFIGLFQVLSLIPGTSRSGITIIGALILGCSRFIATEFTFYLAVPVMLGASGLKLVKYLFVRHMSISGTQAAALFVAMAVAYVVSIFVIRFLISYVKRHDFSPFGVYRIVLGLVVLLVFGLLL